MVIVVDAISAIHTRGTAACIEDYKDEKQRRLIYKAGSDLKPPTVEIPSGELMVTPCTSSFPRRNVALNRAGYSTFPAACTQEIAGFHLSFEV